jgi:hypothetical protein
MLYILISMQCNFAYKYVLFDLQNFTTGDSFCFLQLSVRHTINLSQ